MSKRIAIIDLDTPCFAASAVAEKRSILVTHKPSNIQKQFNTRTDFKSLLKSKNKLDRLEEYEIVDHQEPEPIENACYTLKRMIENYQEAIGAEEAMFFISGKGNFRDDLDLPNKYKSNRTDMIRPLLLQDVRKFATLKYRATVTNGYEPDDAIIFTAYDLKRRGYEPVIISIDKDSLAYSGLLLYNQDKPEKGVIEIPNFGSLWIDDKNKVRGIGFIWYCFQHLLGDKTDFFCPTDICNIKFGEKSAYNLLKDCKNETEALQVVVDQFKKWYPEATTYIAWNGKEYTKNYVELLDLYFKCCRMKSHEFDELDFVEFVDQYGVKL